jgi:hypothetical protein
MDSCSLAHHWIIDALPTRGSYHATCKVCGEERDFPEDATRFKFRMTKNVVPAPVVERLLGRPGPARQYPAGETRQQLDTA